MRARGGAADDNTGRIYPLVLQEFHGFVIALADILDLSRIFELRREPVT